MEGKNSSIEAEGKGKGGDFPVKTRRDLESAQSGPTITSGGLADPSFFSFNSFRLRTKLAELLFLCIKNQYVSCYEDYRGPAGRGFVLVMECKTTASSGEIT